MKWQQLKGNKKTGKGILEIDKRGDSKREKIIPDKNKENQQSGIEKLFKKKQIKLTRKQDNTQKGKGSLLKHENRRSYS